MKRKRGNDMKGKKSIGFDINEIPGMNNSEKNLGSAGYVYHTYCSLASRLELGPAVGSLMF